MTGTNSASTPAALRSASSSAIDSVGLLRAVYVARSADRRQHVDVGQHETAISRHEQPGHGERVAAGRPAIDTDDHLVEHLLLPCLCRD